MDISESEDIMGENELEKRLIEAAEKGKSLMSFAENAANNLNDKAREKLYS